MLSEAILGIQKEQQKDKFNLGDEEKIAGGEVLSLMDLLYG